MRWNTSSFDGVELSELQGIEVKQREREKSPFRDTNPNFPRDHHTLLPSHTLIPSYCFTVGIPSGNPGGRKGGEGRRGRHGGGRGEEGEGGRKRRRGKCILLHRSYSRCLLLYVVWTLLGLKARRVPGVSFTEVLL